MWVDEFGKLHNKRDGRVWENLSHWRDTEWEGRRKGEKSCFLFFLEHFISLRQWVKLTLFLKKLLFIYFYFWLYWAFLAACRLFPPTAGSRAALCCRAQRGSYSPGLSYRGAQGLGLRALWPHGTWSLPGPETEPVSPALAGRFLSTVPLGKSSKAYSSVQFSHSVMSDSLRPHELKRSFNQNGAETWILRRKFY